MSHHDAADLYAAALGYAARGWHVLPLHNPTPTGGCSCGVADCSSVGKHPRTEHGLSDATTDPAKIKEWRERWPDANVGVRTGTPSGCFVLDVDSDEAAAALKASGRTAPTDALRQRTGRGWQVFFTLPDFTVKNTAGVVADHVDTRGEGGYVVVAPSLHANGKRYRWLTEGEPGPAPAWLLEVLRPKEREKPIAPPAAMHAGSLHRYLAAALEDEAAKVRSAADGSRNATLNEAAFSLGQLEAAGLSRADAESELTAAASAAGLTPLEIVKTFQSGWLAGRQDPREIPPPKVSGTQTREPAAAAPLDADPHPPGAKKSTADRLVELGRSRYHFGQSVEGDPFGVPKDGPRIARLLRGQGGSLRADMAAAYLETFSKTPTQSALADAVCVLEGLALRGPREPLHVRHASHDGAVWVDLGDATGRAVQVTASGWTVETSPPVLFRRSALTGALPEPEAGELCEWRRFLNVTDETWALLVGCLVSTLHPDYPHPVLALQGEQGSAKSTTARQYIDLVDPSAAPLRSAPRDIGEWVTVAAGSAVIGLDNVSHIPAWLSDALCRAVTGDGFPRRALYSDGDIVVTAFRRAVVLNGIDMGALSGDLVDRAAFVELKRIPKERRRLDNDLARDFAAARPALLGGLFDLVAATLYHLPAVKLSGYPRMADHAKVLAALDMAADLGALSAFLAVAGRAFEEAVDGDQVAAAVRRFAETRDEWSGELADLLETLTQALRTPDRPPKGWPPDAARLSGRLKRAAPALRAVGVAVELGEDLETRHRTVTISQEKVRKSARDARDEQAIQGKQAEIPTLSRDLPDLAGVGGSAALSPARENQAAIDVEPVASGSAPDPDEEPEPFVTTTEADGSRLVAL